LFSWSWLLTALRTQKRSRSRAFLLYRAIVREEVGLRLVKFSASHSHSHPGHRSNWPAADKLKVGPSAGALARWPSFVAFVILLNTTIAFISTPAQKH
jgi:hypothetical protein